MNRWVVGNREVVQEQTTTRVIGCVHFHTALPFPTTDTLFPAPLFCPCSALSFPTAPPFPHHSSNPAPYFRSPSTLLFPHYFPIPIPLSSSHTALLSLLHSPVSTPLTNSHTAHHPLSTSRCPLLLSAYRLPITDYRLPLLHLRTAPSHSPPNH